MQLHEVEKTQENAVSKINLIISIVLLVLISILSFFSYYSWNEITDTKKQIETLKNDNISLNKKLESIVLEASEPTPDDTPVMAYRPVSYQGVVKKEEVPEEYALGDFWYFLYFDVAQTVETVAGERNIESIEISANESGLVLDEYLDKKVVVDGRLSTGFAESTIVLVDEITEL